jgi:pimeloyl-ACP methyl ester carboxylesterase
MRVAGIIELGSDFEQFTPSAVIKNVKVPIFLISAKQDEELDGNDAKLLYELANQPKELWEVNSKHDVFHEHPGEFKQRMRTFLQKYAE